MTSASKRLLLKTALGAVAGYSLADEASSNVINYSEGEVRNIRSYVKSDDVINDWSDIIDLVLNDISCKEVVFDIGVVYKISRPIFINRPIVFGSKGTWSTLGDVNSGVAIFSVTDGFSGDVFVVTTKSTGSLINGILIDCAGQVNGNGFLLKGGKAFRCNRRISNVCIKNSSGCGLFIDRCKEDYFYRICATANNLHGVYVSGVDLYFNIVFGYKNKGSGLFYAAGSGAGRFDRCDFWDNSTYGVELRGQNASFLALQVDLNKLAGVCFRSDSTNAKLKRYQFVGGNSLAGRVNSSDILFVDAASDVVFVGWYFGYGKYDEPAAHAVEDRSGSSVFTLVGCCFESKAYSKDLVMLGRHTKCASSACFSDNGVVDVSSPPVALIFNSMATPVLDVSDIYYIGQGAPVSYFNGGRNGRIVTIIGNGVREIVAGRGLVLNNGRKSLVINNDEALRFVFVDGFWREL